MTRYGQAFEAFLNGCNNSADVAIELGISKAFASLLVSELHNDGMIRRTGRRCARQESFAIGLYVSRFNAMTPFIYEIVPKE